jgi:drug/metabolite transporter (DMT)-like permease
MGGKARWSYGSTGTNSDDEMPAIQQQKEEFHRQNHSLWGIFFIMLGSFSFSVMFLIVKLMGPAANTFTLVTYRSLVQILIGLGIVISRRENPLGPPEARFWLCCRGLFGSLAVAAWFFGIQILPLPDAVTLQFTTPPFAAAIAVCLVGEKWLLLDIIGAIVCLTGVALIAHPTWLFGSTSADGKVGDVSPLMKAAAILVTEAGAAMAGIAYVSVRKIGDRASAVVMVIYYAGLSIPICILGSGMLIDKWNVFADTRFSVKDYALLLLMGLGG